MEIWTIWWQIATLSYDLFISNWKRFLVSLKNIHWNSDLNNCWNSVIKWSWTGKSWQILTDLFPPKTKLPRTAALLHYLGATLNNLPTCRFSLHSIRRRQLKFNSLYVMWYESFIRHFVVNLVDKMQRLQDGDAHHLGWRNIFYRDSTCKWSMAVNKMSVLSSFIPK